LLSVGVYSPVTLPFATKNELPWGLKFMPNRKKYLQCNEVNEVLAFLTINFLSSFEWFILVGQSEGFVRR